jgi:RNA polymerase sigma-70 factor, ECF subfamily
MLVHGFEALLVAARAGDEQAYAVLWRELQPPLLRYLEVVAPEAAEDLASETWLRVVTGLDRFRGDERAFRAWLFTVARHRVIDRWRQVGRGRVDPVPLEALADRPAPDDPAEETVETISTRAAVALIATLPPEQAEAIMLRVVAGLGVPEVARIMGKRPGAVRVLTHRALRRLADRLGSTERIAGAV